MVSAPSYASKRGLCQRTVLFFTLLLFQNLLQTLRQLIGTGGVLEAAADTLKAAYDLINVHTLHKLGDALQIAAASAHALVQVISIQRSDFDHGGTRDMTLQQSSGDVVLFMTQDALPTDAHYIENLIAPFSDEQVAAVGGRQIAYPDARPFEKAVRSFNYPAADRVWDKADIARLGVRAYLISDVCAAYRRSAYLAVGGFDHPIMTNEDMLMAQKLLQAGYKLAYSGGASVYHSHHFTLRQEYKRNHLIGWTMKHYEERFGHAEEMGEGVKLAVNVVKSLLKQGHVLECIPFAFNCAARLLGNRAGRRAAGKEMA